MSLSCACDYDYDPEPGMWLYWPYASEEDFVPLEASRRKRCCSCGSLIDIGALCVVHARRRYPYTEMEARMVGADPEMNEEPPIKIASHYQCEPCGEIWLNLQAAGYECLSPSENMPAALKEYHQISGFKNEG